MKNLLSVAAAGVLAFQAGAARAETTLRVWDTFSDEKMNAGMEAFVEAFEAANPDITIERDVQDSDEMRPVIQTALASGTGPDVFYFDTGPGFAGVLAGAGLLLPLDDAYASLGWDRHIFPWTKERTTFGGKVYGIGNEIELLGVYYNKDMFEELQLAVPQTYEDFVKAAEAIKAAGMVPISFGAADGWPSYHMFSLYANNIAGKDKLESLLFADGSWDEPSIIQSIKAFFVDANQARYLLPSPTAISYDDSTNFFISGQAGMMITGTWLIGNIVEGAAFEPGWFFLPKPGGGEPLPPAGLGSGYFVSAATGHPEEAKKFLSFLFDPANARLWAEGMNAVPPYAFDASGMDVPELYKVAIDALAKMQTGYNIDVLTPDKFNTMMSDGFQAVLLDQKTPEQQAKDLQAVMAEYRAAKN